MHVLDFSLQTQVDLLSWVGSGAVQLVKPDGSDLQRVIQLTKKHPDLPMDFADGLLVATCERLNVKRVVTIDHDFSGYRYEVRGHFVNVFFEFQRARVHSRVQPVQNLQDTRLFYARTTSGPR